MKFRLLTEAEWEFAARGGNKTNDYIYSGSDNINEVAWCQLNAAKKTYEVATKKPNELGLYDMSGNVSEWCMDWWTDKEYSSSTCYYNPQGPNGGARRVIRGGSWKNDPTYCKTVYCFFGIPFRKDATTGFRLALSEEGSTKAHGKKVSKPPREKKQSDKSGILSFFSKLLKG
jgi:formylglycine-generating enzyme required for sulfatase activity